MRLNFKFSHVLEILPYSFCGCIVASDLRVCRVVSAFLSGDKRRSLFDWSHCGPFFRSGLDYLWSAFFSENEAMGNFMRTHLSFQRMLAGALPLLLTSSLYACATCYGDPNSPQSKGVNMAVWTMLGVTVCVLLSFGVAILQFRKKIINASTASGRSLS